MVVPLHRKMEARSEELLENAGSEFAARLLTNKSERRWGLFLETTPNYFLSPPHGREAEKGGDELTEAREGLSEN